MGGALIKEAYIGDLKVYPNIENISPVKISFLKYYCVVGDLCFYDKLSNKYVIGQCNSNGTYISLDRYKLVGVVAVAGNRYGGDFYEDDTVSIVSLNLMNVVYPDTGIINNYVVKKEMAYSTVILAIGKIYPWFSLINLEGNTILPNVLSLYIPTDVLVTHKDWTIENPKDSSGVYYYKEADIYGESFHITPGNGRYINPIYLEDTDNAYSDKYGRNNTSIMWQKALAISDYWKISDNLLYTEYPAACCCWRYCPEGTKLGDWYLPSIGLLISLFEKLLFILYSFWNDLNAFQKQFALFNYFHSSLATYKDNVIMSSTQSDNSHYYALNFLTGQITCLPKNLESNVFAFMDINDCWS